MDLVKTARIIRRRWYAVLIGVLCTLGGVAFVVTMPPIYEATSVLVLLAPNTPATVTTGPGAAAGPVNPYQAFDSSITITATLMGTQVMQPTVVDALVRQGASPDFTVATDPNTGGPTVTITAKASTPSQALITTRLVTDEFRRQLNQRQAEAGAPESSMITASPVVTPSTANRLVSGRIRALVAVLAVGMVVSICLALAAESMALARDRRRDRRLPSGGSSTDPSSSGTVGAESIGAQPTEAASWH